MRCADDESKLCDETLDGNRQQDRLFPCFVLLYLDEIDEYRMHYFQYVTDVSRVELFVLCAFRLSPLRNHVAAGLWNLC